MDLEFLKALELVAEFDRCRPVIIKETRLYYNEDGSIIGVWETDHPAGNYIVLDNLDLFNSTNTLQLYVADGALKKIETTKLDKSRLVKSTTGQRVVKGMAALALTADEEYQNVEYYDRKTIN